MGLRLIVEKKPQPPGRASSAHAATLRAGAARKYRVLGPAHAPLARLRNEHRFQVLLKGQRPAMRAAEIATAAVERLSDVALVGSWLAALGSLLPYALIIASFTFLYVFVPNTRVRFVPALNFNGAVPVATYTVSDGLLTDTGTLTLTVNAVNDAPRITNFAADTAADGSRVLNALRFGDQENGVAFGRSPDGAPAFRR